MTTKVFIRVDKPSHRDVRVDMMGVLEVGGTRKAAHVTLGEGDQREFYVYEGQQLRVSEVSKGLARREEAIAKDRLARQFLD